MTHQDPKIGERVNKLWIALLFGLLMAGNVGAELYISNQATGTSTENKVIEVERSTPTTFNMYGSTQIVKTECFEWIHKWLDKQRMETKGNQATVIYTESICTKEYLFMSDGRVLWRKVEP
jgi:hypothetical protein